MNKKSVLLKIFLTFIIIFIVFVVASIPGTIKLANKIKVLENKFCQQAVNPDIIRMEKSNESIILEYNGRLDKIIQKRNRTIKENGGIFWGAWTASGRKKISKKGNNFYVEPEIATVVFKPFTFSQKKNE